MKTRILTTLVAGALLLSMAAASTVRQTPQAVVVASSVAPHPAIVTCPPGSLYKKSCGPVSS